jgi:hypothetical protein
LSTTCRFLFWYKAQLNKVTLMRLSVMLSSGLKSCQIGRQWTTKTALVAATMTTTTTTTALVFAAVRDPRQLFGRHQGFLEAPFRLCDKMRRAWLRTTKLSLTVYRPLPLTQPLRLQYAPRLNGCVTHGWDFCKVSLNFDFFEDMPCIPWFWFFEGP